MTGRTTTERILDAYLAPEADGLPDRVIDAALDEVARTPQRRAMRAPWRFPTMPALSRATGIAAVALVAVVGAGGLIYLNSRAPGGQGGQATTTPTQAPVTHPASTPEPSASFPGITGFTPYTSPVYGITFGYPDGWRLEAAASDKPQPGEQPGDGNFELFANPEDRDGDGIAFIVWQQPSGAGDDITSREGLAAWFQANLCDEEVEAAFCETVPDVAMPMCLGKAACRPAILVPSPDGVQAVFAESDASLVTIVSLGRADGFPATARYGGGVQLLKSILTTFDVWTPEPGAAP